MENIVMASVIGQPVADGNIYSGVSPKADGLFGILVNAEITRLPGPAKGSEKKAGQAASDPMILLLMSTLLQGINTQTDAIQPVTAAGEQPAISDIQQAAPVTVTGYSDVLKELQMLLSANTEAAGAFKALFSGLGDKDGGNKVGAAMQQLLAARQLANATPDAAAAGLQTQTVQQDDSVFSALLNVLSGTQSQQDATQATQGNAVLNEIRQLFSELIAAEPAAAEAQASVSAPVPAPMRLQQTDAPQSQEVSAAGAVETKQLSGPAGAILHKLEVLIKSLQGKNTTEDAQAQGSPADMKTGTANELEPANGKTKQAEAFGAAMRAYHGNSPVAAAATAEPRAVAAAVKPGSEAFDSIVQSISQMQGTSQSEMEIHLKPDFLGKVVIKLTMDEGGLVAKIVASNPKVQDAFLNNATALQSSLADQGLKDVRIVVMSSSVQDPSLQQQADRRGQGQNQQHKRNRLAIDALEQPDLRALTAYEPAYGTGTINYLA